MGDDRLDAFVRLVSDDRLLQAELRDITDRNVFVEQVVEAGRRKGYDFSSADVEEAMRSNRRKWLRT
jgi:hypothetical protein